MLKKRSIFTLLSAFILTGCAENLKPVGCWEDQFQAVYRFKPQGVVTKKLHGELRPSYRGNWEMIDSNQLVLQFSDQAPEKYTIVSVTQNQMTIKLNGIKEFSWPKTSCM